MAQKDILLKNFHEYFELAELAFEKKKYNGAVTLYYKALVELCDISLLEKSGKVGVNHSERFQLLRSHEPGLYKKASALFSYYRDSYTSSIPEKIAAEVREKVEDAKRQVLDE
jgi:hypothetical protein